MGIDVGTSSVKAGLYTLDGTCLGVEAAPVALDRAADGAVTQDLDGLYAAAAQASREAMAASQLEAGQVAALAVDGQMAGLGLVDADHRPVAPYDSWLDARCEAVLNELPGDLAQAILRRSGCAPTISGGPKMAWWARYKPAVTARAAKFVTAGGYVAGRAVGLPGHEAFIDPTYLHFQSVADGAAGTWAPDLAQAMGIPQALLPRIVGCSDVVGHLMPAAAAQFGLPAGLPLAAGCGDTAAAAAGAGVSAPGQAFDVAGTAAVLGVHVPRFEADPTGTLLTMRSPLGDGCYALAYVGGAGEIIDWLVKTVLGHPAVDAAAYAELAAAAAGAPPGCEGLIASPHFSGRICPAAPAMRGSFIGLTPSHGRAHLVRAVLEAIAFEYRGYAQAALQLTGLDRLTEVVGMGGGTQLGLWNQIKAAVLDAPYRPLRDVDIGTRGAAMVAIAALGEAVPPVRPGRFGPTVPPPPDPAAARAYQAAARHYEAWARHLAAAYERKD
jgi:xylulokinase